MGLINQRRSFRCPVAADHSSAELRAGDKHYPAQLLDESADGFSLGLDENPELRAGQTAILRTTTGYFEVEIVHCCRVELAVMGSQASPCRYRIGVRRLRYLCAEDERPQGIGDGASPWHRNPLLGWLGWKLAVAGLLLVAGIAAAGSYAGWGSRNRWRLDSEETDAATRLWAHRSADADPNWPAAKGGRSDSSGGASGGTSSDVAYWPANQETAQLRAKVEALPGALALIEPSIALRLDLTSTQRAKIRHIIELAEQACESYAAAAAQQQSPPGSKGVDLPSKRAHLVDAARRDALKLLTAEQREMFQQLIEPSRAGN